MVYSTDRSKAVVPVLVLLFVALWFILGGDLLYVFPCVILFLCFSVLLVLRLPRLGKRELILVLFVRLFDLCLFGFVGFLSLLGSGKGCGMWLLHSLDFSLTFFFFYLPLMKKIRYIFLKSYVKLTLGTHGQWADVNQNQGKRPTTPGVTFLDRFYNLPLMKIFCHAFLKNCKG